MQFDRASGVLLHLTSLPSRYGIGDLGKKAYDFIDFLKRANQKLWQILPLNPPASGGSPYNCFSAFAGNALLISIDKLIEDGLLKVGEVTNFPKFSETRVEFSKVIKFKNELFLAAFNRFNVLAEGEGYKQFKEENEYWLSDFCLYIALKEHFNNRVWNQWDTDIAFREKQAIEKYQSKLADKIHYQEFLQYIFSKQWSELKNYANHNGIKIIGDLPIFVAHDSSDVWVHPELFDLDDEGNSRKVAGVPPDYFSKTGQLWGNPHYNWKRMQEDNFLWWRKRFEKLLKQVDITRIDHFRGFEAYWEVDASEKTAERGKWVKAPGYVLFSAVKQYLGELPIIVEDLGFITPEVNELKESFGFPGMKILQFSFDEKTTTKSGPDNYEKHCVAYTGTHDNDTLLAWYRGLLKQPKNIRVLKILEKCYGITNEMSEEKVCWALIEAVYKSKANFVIVPLQDILCLDNEARMNFPGTVWGNNWLWRYRKGDITKGTEEKLALLAKKYHR
ncbi:MAG: 4-alpha-glucanotransferase [Candidatus Caldatribacteriota bacterium]|nr:4-alpha-glucanotransferase [Candidatus Caldatribacteriota bacterium]